jgi:hypothetical protein
MYGCEPPVIDESKHYKQIYQKFSATVCSAEVQNEWSCISTPTVRPHGIPMDGCF